VWYAICVNVFVQLLSILSAETVLSTSGCHFFAFFVAKKIITIDVCLRLCAIDCDTGCIGAGVVGRIGDDDLFVASCIERIGGGTCLDRTGTCADADAIAGANTRARTPPHSLHHHTHTLSLLTSTLSTMSLSFRFTLYSCFYSTDT
jgi:hypothetical protein